MPELSMLASALGDTIGLSGWILVGVVIGFVVGAIPGFSSSNALAIMLPVLIFMDVTTAITLMAAVYCGAEMGGSVPAILVNIPGTPGAIATTFDGYAMAKEGNAAFALAISAAASMFGGLLTTAITLVALPSLALLALQFGTVQNFVVVLFGVVLIGQLSSENPIKGLAAGLAGLLFGVVGADHVYGVPRATLGIIELYDGIPVIPALIGLFAVTEIFWMMQRRKVAAETSVPMQALVTYRAALGGFVFTLRRWGNLIRSSIIGLIIGIIPGVGGNVASLVAYQQATIFDRSKRYGQGEPNGVLAAEAANNAVITGAMIPLFTLALPGSGTAVVMLTVLQAHGLLLGPQLMAQHPDIPFTVIASMVLANVVLGVVSFLLIPMCARVTQVKMQWLAPIVLALSLLGAFATRSMVFDLYVAVAFGLLGYFMRLGKYPVQPLILGIVLSPYLEEYYTRALRLGGDSPTIFFDDNVSIILWILLALALLWPLFRRIRDARAMTKDGALGR